MEKNTAALSDKQLLDICCKQTNPSAVIRYEDTFLRIAQAVQREVIASHPAPQAAAEGVGSIAPIREGGTPAPEAGEFVRLMRDWRFADVGEPSKKAFAAVVACIDSRAAPARAAIQPAGELKELMRDVMSWATTYGSLLSGEDWHGMRDKVIDDRLATYLSLSSVTSEPACIDCKGVSPSGTDENGRCHECANIAAHSSNAAPSDDLTAACHALIAYVDQHPPMAGSLWCVQRIRAALAAPSERKFTLEDVEKIVRYSLAAQRERLAAPAPTGESVSVPNATVIKKGAERYFMSENLGHLPDGTYSLYLAPAAGGPRHD